MMLWKEWKALRGRFFTLAAFYLITLLVLPLDSLFISLDFETLPLSLLSIGIGLLIIPMILGMDAYVVERDEGTEDFLLSKPISRAKLMAVKVGVRLLLTLVLSALLFAIVLIRAAGTVESLHMSIQPYTVWYVTLSVMVAQLVVVVIISTVSVKAPYQSTALILGGLLGIAVASLPSVISAWQLISLQAPWESFIIQIVILLLTLTFALSVYGRLEAGRSEP
jgi:ABC-type transport system involved in multi-copper enzyme maturation permease subunit